ncbi:MAG TPA: zinc ribbon domain-containing protein [Nitrososphaeraceae archaeon]|nr:zinc ribbon domain-containing protein [Nitrososphaeraceae archaeon]
MKLFNGKSAAEEYMSTHTLTFSTPEMTLKKFAYWLSEIIEFQGEQVPRLMLFLETKKDIPEDNESINDNSIYTNLLPDVDESFRPTGAISDMFNRTDSSSSENKYTDDHFLKKTGTADSNFLSNSKNQELKFCIECGIKLKYNSKFCIKCGSKQ